MNSPIITDHPNDLGDCCRIQNLAADPGASVWVSASAGTGKTKVLTDRVLNLLLQGVSPRRILCLTYTRAASSEMSLRLLQKLGNWACSNDKVLASELAELQSVPQVSPLLLPRARQLFVDVLNTPGGLNIQTIHSFCQSILQRFPMEARIPPNFVIADPEIARELLEESIRDLFVHAREDGDMGAILSDIARNSGAGTLLVKIQEILGGQLTMDALRNEGLDAAVSRLWKDLGISLLQRPMEILESYFFSMPVDRLLGYVPALQSGGVEDQNRAAVFLMALRDPGSFSGNFPSYRKCFLTASGEVRSRLASKAAQGAGPGILDIMEEEAQRLIRLEEKLKSNALARQGQAWMKIGLWIHNRYSVLKEERGLLDYNDLVTRACSLLHEPGLAPFILYKLDGGIHHILVDEAQDTSPAQWALISAIAEEFFSGIGALNRPTSLFAVGDFKQSIYSFQGAAPQLFRQMRHHFSSKVRDARQTWRSLEMQMSFRSTPPVLEAVDRIFNHPEISSGILDEGEDSIIHYSYRSQGAGCVELWPLVPQPEADKTRETEKPPRRPEERLAEVIAIRIRKWLDEGTILENHGRPIRPSDILILVQRRNHFIHSIVRALKRHNVPTSGLDRLELFSHMAVQDILALARFLLLPQDDLSLAIVLRSPLVGLDEVHLFRITRHRLAGEPLWHALLKVQDENPLFIKAVELLKTLLGRADYVSPFHLFGDVLYAGGGMKRFISRLGMGVQEILEEFLMLVQNHGLNHTHSLQALVEWCEKTVFPVRRDSSAPGLDEVRIMTVHGAKGLQSPIVFLADTTRVPDLQEEFLWSPSGYLLPNVGKDAEVELLTGMKLRARQHMLEEYRRLLYVAMTRAGERLYVCGWEPVHGLRDDCWYSLCRRSLEGSRDADAYFDFTDFIFDGWKGNGLRFSQEAKVQVSSFCDINVQNPIPSIVVDTPSFLFKPVEHREREESFEKTTATEGVELKEPRRSGNIDLARERGHYVHRLLEVLPFHDADSRDSHIFRIQRAFPSVPKDEAGFLAEKVCTILHDPDLAFLFGPTSMAEVPITGFFNGKLYSVRIDRLVREKDRIVIIDYKSNMDVPPSQRDVPYSYLKQLSVYRTLATLLYPGMPIVTGILWLRNASLMWVDVSGISEAA